MVNQLNELYNFYNKKTVLVTGHTGFKGSWLTLWLEKMGANVIGVGLNPKNPNDNFNLTKYERLIDYRFDIRDSLKLKEVFSKHNPDIIFHLAAQPLVIDSYLNPSYTYDVNVNGTLNLLERIKELKKEITTVIVTTDKVYKNTDTNIAFKETDPLGGHDPYSASKAMVEIISESYYKSFFKVDSEYNKGLATARAGNVIGGGDWSENRLIPDFMNAYNSNKKFYLRNPSSLRPWQFVLEPLSGYLILALNLHKNPNSFSDAWNFGPDKKTRNLTVLDILKKFNNFIDSSVEVSIKGDNVYHENKYLALDSSKANKFLFWHNIMEPEEMLNNTFDWYQKKINNISIDNSYYIAFYEDLLT